MYAGASYGSITYGGSGGVVNSTQNPTVQTLSLTLHTPVWIAKHSNPAQFAQSLTLHFPTLKITHIASEQSLTVTQHDGTPRFGVVVPTFSLSLTQHDPTPSV